MRKQPIDINHGSTLFLRAAILGLGAAVMLLNFLVVPAIYREWPLEIPHLASWRYMLIAVILITSLIFFEALRQISNLLGMIDRNRAFSRASVRAMKNVKNCGLLMSGLYALCMPLIFLLAEADDAPGLILIFGFIFIGVPLIVAVFAGVAERLFQNAIDIKSENDLTV